MRRVVCGAPGFIAIELVLGIGILLFPVTMLVTSLPRWSERQTMARTAATEAARAWARAGDDRIGQLEGDRQAREVARHYGVAEEAIDIAYEGSARVRGGSVRVAVTVEMPVTAIPLMGSVPGWTWTARHTEAVDLYRSFAP